MLSDIIAAYRLLKPDKSKDKQLVQSQLVTLVEHRRESCARLWGSLWRWLDDIGHLEGESQKEALLKDKLNELHATITQTAPEIGALVSSDTFLCLAALQIALNRKRVSVDDVADCAREVRAALLPDNPDSGGRGKWGLLMLLRDEIGSNALAASALLT